MDYRSPSPLSRGKTQTPRAAPIRSIRSIIVATILVVFPAQHVSAQGGPAKVVVSPAAVMAVEPTMRLTGTVRPRLRSLVATEVAGLVEELPVDVGDPVRKGDLLCKLRDVVRVAAHEEAVARREELAEICEERRALLSKAEFERKRIAGLFEGDRSTEKEMNDAAADCRAAERRVKQAERALMAQDAVIKVLEDNLRRTEIRAPFDGCIVSKQTEIGSWVDVGGTIVELVDLSVARARINVPESIVDHCTVGDPALVTVDALGEDFSARITRVSPDGDERARTFPIEIDIENPGGRIRAGMFVKAAVPAGKRQERLVVPKDAVVERGPVRMIFVVRDGDSGPAASPIPVTVVSEIEDKVAVEAPGLKDKDRVVVRGNEYMFGPSAVIIMPEEGAEPAKGGKEGGPETTAQVGATP